MDLILDCIGWVMCGIVGLINPVDCQNYSDQKSNASHDVCKGLLTLQHRGQDAAGISSYSNNFKKFFIKKSSGLVAANFDENSLDRLPGEMAIGHTRYATMGSNDAEDLQPLVQGYPFGVSLAHNGNIVNYTELKNLLRSKYRAELLTNNDLEVLLALFCANLETNKNKVEEFDFAMALNSWKELARVVQGAYAIVGIVAGKGLMGVRDPWGIRPLVLGRKKVGPNEVYSYCLSSETVSLQFLGFEIVRPIEPGEFIFISNTGDIYSSKIRVEKNISQCMFEWVYFSGAESEVDEVSVYGARLKLGKLLARRMKSDYSDLVSQFDLVCPVPDTSRTAAISMAEELKIPYREGLIKNRYIQRSFILNAQDKREKAVELKLSPVKSEIMGKRILLVDDSVVRGTTSKKIIDLLKKHGAESVTLAVTCPPLRFGCAYGIDFPNREELIANGKTEDEIATFIGASKIIYLTVEDLKEATGKQGLCLACLNGIYPTGEADIETFKKLRTDQKEKGK